MANSVRQKRFWNTSDAVALGVAFLAIVCEALFPSTFHYRIIATIVGVIVLIGSLSLLITAKQAFQKSHQSTKPGEEITELITTGIFNRYRNPIYVSVIANVYAVGLLVDSVWLSGGAIVVWAILHYRFVVFEERYLAEKFGEEYIMYLERSRRWL